MVTDSSLSLSLSFDPLNTNNKINYYIGTYTFEGEYLGLAPLTD